MRVAPLSAIVVPLSGAINAPSFQEVGPIYQTFARDDARIGATPVAAAKPRRDDKAMLRAAADLTRDLNVPSARIYWTDFLGSALAG